MAASVSDGSAATSHQELETLLAAEGAKDCRFDHHPVSVALGISLLEIANTPPDILPGPIPDNVFVEGLKVPGLVLGVKESRARQKLLLCFGNDEDRNSSLAHLKSVQRTSKPLFNSFSGHHCKPSLPLAIERREKQAMLCYPLAVDYGESLLPDTWKRQNPPAMVTVHVWNVAMDVLDARVAESRDTLEQHFKPFCQHAAIVLLTPTKDSSTIVTVSVADKESAEYLMKQASALSRFGYFKFVSSQEAVIEAPILVAVREMRRNLVVKVQASEGEDLMTAKLVAEKARSSRVHTSILLRLLHQQQLWHLCLAVKDILYEDKPYRWLCLRQGSRPGLQQLVVPFHQSDVSRFVMNRHWREVENTLQENECKFHSSYPKIDGLHGGCGGLKLIVIESYSVEGLHRAKADIDALAARISRSLVQRRIHLHTTDLQLLTESRIPYADPRSYARMPSLGYVDWLGLCHADVKLRMDDDRARSVTIEACRFSNIHKASVDVLVVFMNWDMMPTSGDAASVVRDGRSTVTEEINAHYESGRHAQRGQPAALSSGCLNCKAILCSSIPGKYHENLCLKLKEILATCRQMGAKSIAVARPGKNADSLTWLSALCDEVVQDVLTGGSLERVVTSLRLKSENTLQFASGSLQTALGELRNSKGRDIMSFDVVQDKRIAPLQRCYLPTACVITAETSKDLDGAKEKMTAFLNAALQERVVPCSSVQCQRVVQCWRNCHMDMKVGCRLCLRDTNSHEITLRGPPSLLDSAVKSLKALIFEMTPTSDDSSTADLPELGIGMDDRSHDAGFAEQERHSPVRELQTSTTSSEEDTDLSIVDFKYGRVRLRRVRGFVCGEYRTGKSSFIRATLGDEFIEGADSTPGVHVERTMVHFDSGSGCEDPFERIPGVAQLFVESMAELVHQKSKQDDSEPGYEATPTVAGPVCGEVATAHFPQLSSTPINGHEPLTELPCMVSAISLEDVGVGSTLVEEPIATSDQSRFSTYPDDSLLREFLPMESSEFKALEFDQQEKMKAEVRAQLKRIQDLPQDKPVSRTYFEFWDCAGQMAMTTQQSICLDTARSFFVLVFDASKDLNEEVTVEIYRQDGKDIEIPPLFKGMTHRDFILMWLAVIAFRQQQNASASKLGQNAKIRKTTVFLVGTHIDEVPDQDKDSITSKTIDEMEKISRQAGSDNLELKGPYFVDNRRIQDAVVKDPRYNQMVELRKELAKTIESVEEEEMPLSWMMLEDALHLWRECKQSSERATSSYIRHHMTFSFFKELAHFIFKDDSADVEEVLKLFHQLGSVICHDCDHLQDDSLIFLNAEWMLKEFVKLLIFPLQKKRPRDQLSLADDLKDLRKKGIVSAPLLKAVWSDLDESVRKSIMATMCHFDLACKRFPDTVPGDGGVACSEHDSQSYFVPFCLTRDESKADLPTSDDEGDEGDDAQVRPPSLLLKFKAGFFPPPIYSRVAVYCASQFRANDVSMEHSAMAFYVETEESVHASRISWSPYGLKLELCSSREEKEVQTACANLLGAVDNCLEKLKNHQGYAGLSWHLAFPCAHETHRKEAQAKPTAMTRLDNWIEIPANWHKNGVKGKRCDSCEKLSKVPADVKKYWLRSDPLARVSSNDGATAFVAGEDSRQANRAQVPTMEQDGTAADFSIMALDSERAGNVPNQLLPEAAANRMPPANNAIVVNCSAPDLLDSAAYKELRLELTETMDMGRARYCAEAFSLITPQQQDDLRTALEPKGREPHNRELFRIMEVGGKSTLKDFAAKVLSRMGPNFAKMKERLEQLLARAPADVKTHWPQSDQDAKISGGGSSSSNNIGNDSFVKKSSSSKLEHDGTPHAGYGSTAGNLATTVCGPNSSTSFGQVPSNPIVVSTSAEGSSAIAHPGQVPAPVAQPRAKLRTSTPPTSAAAVARPGQDTAPVPLPRAKPRSAAPPTDAAVVRTGTSAGSSRSKKDVPSTAALPEERHGNPWKHERFIETTYSLQEKLTQLIKVRGLCYSLRLIGTESYNQLQLLESKSKHNEKLLSYLMTGDAVSFAKFREVMRHLNQEVNVFAKILEKWDTIGPFKEDYQYMETELNDK